MEPDLKPSATQQQRQGSRSTREHVASSTHSKTRMPQRSRTAAQSIHVTHQPTESVRQITNTRRPTHEPTHMTRTAARASHAPVMIATRNAGEPTGKNSTNRWAMSVNVGYLHRACQKAIPDPFPRSPSHSISGFRSSEKATSSASIIPRVRHPVTSPDATEVHKDCELTLADGRCRARRRNPAVPLFQARFK